MKLSEALRLGEFALPAIYGKWIYKDSTNKPCGGCAVGRTAYAAGFNCTTLKGGPIEEEAILDRFFDSTWPWTVGFIPPCAPHISQMEHNKRLDGANTNPTNNNIVSTLSWSYETEKLSMTELANYIESFEPQDVPVATSVTEEVQYETK